MPGRVVLGLVCIDTFTHGGTWPSPSVRTVTAIPSSRSCCWSSRVGSFPTSSEAPTALSLFRPRLPWRRSHEQPIVSPRTSGVRCRRAREHLTLVRAGAAGTVAVVLRRFLTRLVVALVLVVTIIVGGFVLVNVIVESKLASADRIDLTLAEPPSDGGANYLLIGSDSRDFVQSEDDAGFFGDVAEAGGNRSDTIMVLHTDPDSGSRAVVLFPVRPVGRRARPRESRINAVFNEGPQAVIDTLANDFSVPIHHYTEVNFESFAEIVTRSEACRCSSPPRHATACRGSASPFPGAPRSTAAPRWRSCAHATSSC